MTLRIEFFTRTKTFQYCCRRKSSSNLTTNLNGLLVIFIANSLKWKTSHDFNNATAINNKKLLSVVAPIYFHSNSSFLLSWIRYRREKVLRSNMTELASELFSVTYFYENTERFKYLFIAFRILSRISSRIYSRMHFN